MARASTLTLSREEQLRQERSRQMASGITSYCQGHDGTAQLVALHGSLFLLQGADVSMRSCFNADSIGNAGGGGASGPSDQALLDPQLWRDKVSFVLDNDVYYVAVDRRGSTNLADWAFSEAKRVTYSRPGTSCGLADFLAMEEMDTYRGYWFLPNSLAFLEVDDSHIEEFTISHSGSDHPTGQQGEETHRYPFAGKANPKVRLGIVDLGSDQLGNWDRARWYRGPAGCDCYLARVNTVGNLVFTQWQNRPQSRLSLCCHDSSKDGDCQVLLTEETEVWINLHHMFRVIHKDESGKITFLWASERSGFMHLYLYSWTAGSGEAARLLRQVSGGDYVVESVVGVDNSNDEVYFTGNYGSAIEKHLLKAELGAKRQAGQGDGSGDDHPQVQVLTKQWSGVHNVVMDSNCEYIVDAHSALGERGVGMEFACLIECEKGWTVFRLDSLLN